MKFNTILVDADIMLYSVGFATQCNVYHVWLEGHEGDPSIITTDKRALNKRLKGYTEYEIHRFLHVQPFLSATDTIDHIISGLKKRLGTEDCKLMLFLTGEGNFREQVATIQPYKGNRTADKPVHYDKIKEYLLKKRAFLCEGQEADDQLGIEQILFNKEGITSVIVSIDKDLNQIPGWHYNSTKDSLYHVSEGVGIRWFYEQLLQGDTADNIPGIKSIGPKTATHFLSEVKSPEDMESVVQELYKEAFGPAYEERLIEVGQLLWMRRYPNETWMPLYLGGCVYE